MEYDLFSPNGELEDLILDGLGFPEDGIPVKSGGEFSRSAWDWEYHKILKSGAGRFSPVFYGPEGVLESGGYNHLPAWNLPQWNIL